MRLVRATDSHSFPTLLQEIQSKTVTESTLNTKEPIGEPEVLSWSRNDNSSVERITEREEGFDLSLINDSPSGTIQMTHTRTEEVNDLPLQATEQAESCGEDEAKPVEFDSLSDSENQFSLPTAGSISSGTSNDTWHTRKSLNQCRLCKYSTPRPSLLRRHVAIVHEGTKEFKCTTCDYSTALSTNLKRHNDTVHERRKPFKCTTCDYAAGEARTLKKHRDAVHERKATF